MTHAMEHCQRPWWKRPPFWFVIIVVALLLSFALPLEQGDKPTPMPYSTFLDQLEAGNVASVSFLGAEINGRYKRQVEGAPADIGKARRDSFSSRVPEFGDPALIAELRKQHVVIEVNVPSLWSSLLAHLPWPMLLFLALATLAGSVRLLRGGKAQVGSVATALPAHGMMGIISRLFGKKGHASNPPAGNGDETKFR